MLRQCGDPNRVGRWLAMLLLGILGPFTTVASTQEPSPRPFVERGITYCKIGGANLQLDLARPSTGDGPFPAIVFVHGGGWRSGHRRNFQSEIVSAARRGFAAITVTYRLTRASEGIPAARWPAQIHDVKCSVRWLRTHASRYHVDPNQIGIYGESAGAHLALLVALTDKSAGLEGPGLYSDESSRVQAVVNCYGPTDVTRLHETAAGTRSMLEPLLGGTPPQAAKRYADASPIRYVTKDDPPVLTLHGALDTLVPTEQARLLDQTLKSASVPHDLQFVEGMAHGFPREVRKKSWQDAVYPFFERTLHSVQNGRGDASLANAGGDRNGTKNSPAPPSPRKSRSSSKPPGTRKRSPRDIAEWALAIGGRLHISVNGQLSAELTKPKALPDSNFRLERIALNLNGKLTDADLERFEGLTELRSLNLNTTRIGDDGLSNLQRCGNLEVLGLYGTRVTDRGLAHLAGLKKLRTLILQETRVTAAGVSSLKKSLPDCRIAF